MIYMPCAHAPHHPCPCLQRIMSVKYSFPANLHLSRECLDLISRIFVANPSQASCAAADMLGRI